ncbi:alpha/beta hydrolase [Flavobacteriaceae bacterium TK19130]|nr:alpha/beta hydrolase [Thermobacterium salinum]
MRKFAKFLGFLVAAFLVLLLGMYLLQEKLIFHPEPLADDYSYSFETPFEEIFIEGTDGARLNGLQFSVDKPKGTILYFHGNAGNLARWGEIGQWFTQFDYNVLIMDYRAYGKSTGSLSEKALYEDAQLWYDYLKKSTPENEIIVYGRSLGTTFAAKLAAANKPCKAILETPFYSLKDVAKSTFPFLPIGSLLKYQFPTYTFMDDIECPIVILHGTSDSVVPYESGKKLSKTVSESLMTFVTVPEGDHNNLVAFEEYRQAIQHILQ